MADFQNTVLLRSSWTSIVPRSNKGADLYQDLSSLRNPTTVNVHFLPEDIDYVLSEPEKVLLQLLKADLNYGGLSDIKYNLAVASNKEGVYILRGIGTKDSFQEKDQPESISVLALLGYGEKPTDLLLQNLSTAGLLCKNVFPPVGEFSLPTKQKYLSDLLPEMEIGSQKIPFPKVDNALYLESESVHVHALIEALTYYGYYRSRNDARYGPLTKQAVAELQYDMKERGFYHKAVDGYYGRWTRDGFERYKGRI